MQAGNILIFTDWYLPGFKAGGPIRSIANLIDMLGGEKTFYLLTSNRDFGEKAPYPDIVTGEWSRRGKANVCYLETGLRGSISMIAVIKKMTFDTSYFNSMFSFQFTIFPLLLMKVLRPHVHCVVAPRGMLGEGALGLKKRKKMLFLKLARAFGLFKKVSWHATSGQEIKEIQSHFGEGAKIQLAPNIPSLSFGVNEGRIKRDGVANFVFCSRISPKKNIKKAIELLISAAKMTSGNIRFTIYGPIEDEDYWQSCLQLMKSHGRDNLTINYNGILMPMQIQEEYRHHHFFFMPTLHENYGHAIVEALSGGLPVLISDQTPWAELEKENAGWDISLKEDAKFAAAIVTCVDMDQHQYVLMSENSVSYIKNKIDYIELKASTTKLFDRS